MDAAITATRHLPSRAAAARLGVAPSTVNRWRRRPAAETESA
ncbi:helix-turn-helix domain-containing protein [Streptomyces sp. NPDC016459]